MNALKKKRMHSCTEARNKYIQNKLIYSYILEEGFLRI